MHNKRLLIIRFSSFGDIIQASGVPAAFKQAHPEASVDWLVRSDFAGLLKNHRAVDRLIAFERDRGLSGLIRITWQIAQPGAYTHIYDAHNNIRSRIVIAVFALRAMIGLLLGTLPPRFVRRPKSRLRRWLFFRFRLNTLPSPFRGAESFHWPLAKWGLNTKVPEGPQFFADASIPEDVETKVAKLPHPRVALAASAAWEMKRWPEGHWQELIRQMPDASFILLGGPEDEFLKHIATVAPERVINLAGRLSLAESASLLQQVDLVIANDTGLLHVADQMERPTLALIGPTAFGYPSHRSSRTLEIELWCKPCSKDGRGGCVNDLYQRCLVEVPPERVAAAAREALFSSPLSTQPEARR